MIKTPKLYTAADALQEQPPIDWIVNNFIAAGSLVMFAGEPGSKKTWALLDMAICTSLGEPWLEHNTKQSTVLIVDEESGTRRLHRRIGQAIKGHPPLRQPPLRYTSLNGFNMTQPDDINTLQVLIAEQGAQLVIIDTLADIMPGKDENAVKDVQPIFLALRKIAELTSSAIVLIHHTGKSGTYRGSSAMAGAVDLLVEVSSSSDYVNFKTIKERDIERVTFAAKLELTDERAYLVPADVLQTTDKLPAGQGYVLQYLIDHGAAQVKDITDAADTVSPGTAKNAVYKLAQAGMISRQDRGNKGKDATYAITPAGLLLAEKTS
jgi:DNA-binding MarR family transcriptional regulator